nr:hypothetical protein Iba_chr01aCG16080 [Ipomoea batatas]
MFMYLILVPESTRPELGWNKQNARVSGRGSLWSCVIRFRSPEYRISFPTFMVVILLAGKNGSTLAETQFLATPGSEAIAGMSPLATPIIIPMPVSANARIIAGSAPYNLTLSIDVDSSSFAVASGAGRLSATCP